MSRRIERVNELLLQQISRFFTERQDPDVGFVTFTGVKITDDLSVARVFYSVLGTEEERQRTGAALVRHKHELHQTMRRLESLRRIPHFEFVYDGTPERAARVFELIEKIRQESLPARPPAAASEAEVPAEQTPKKRKVSRPNGTKSLRKKAR
jgi:ribosome-binding factor A